MASSVLRPMGPDSLAPRPAPQAAASGGKPALARQEAPQPEAYLQPAAFAAPAEAELDLLAGFVIEDEPDETDDQPDLVDSASMPYPACVPLYELDAPGKRRRLWVAALALAALGIIAFLVLK